MRHHDDIGQRPEPADVVAHSLGIGRIDRDAVPRRDLRDARFGCRRQLIAVLVPVRGVLQEADLHAFPLDDCRLVRFGDVRSGAGVRDAVRVEHLQRLEDVGSVVGDVVGNADDLHVPGLQGEHASGPGCRQPRLSGMSISGPWGLTSIPSRLA